jgi:two-component system, chemotaxis family, response regulator Rcp1
MRPKPARIVVIEDNPADVFLVRQALREAGIDFELQSFEDGEQALEALSRPAGKAPGLIFLDLNLPRLDGAEVLIRIRNMPALAEVPVAVLTSSESPADMHRAAELGAARFIKKPMALNDFLREVGRGARELLHR